MALVTTVGTTTTLGLVVGPGANAGVMQILGILASTVGGATLEFPGTTCSGVITGPGATALRILGVPASIVGDVTSPCGGTVSVPTHSICFSV